VVVVVAFTGPVAVRISLVEGKKRAAFVVRFEGIGSEWRVFEARLRGVGAIHGSVLRRFVQFQFSFSFVVIEWEIEYD
jgi:hypothetical protein